MIDEKELEIHFMRWLKKHPNVGCWRNEKHVPDKIVFYSFMYCIERGRNYPARPDRKQRNRKLASLAGILECLPEHTKAELAAAVAHELQPDFKRLCDGHFNEYLIHKIILKVYSQTAGIADRESEDEAAARQWKKTDAPFAALGSLRFNYSHFSGCQATDDLEGFKELAEIALLAFDPVAKPALLIEKVLSTDLNELFRIMNLGI